MRMLRVMVIEKADTRPQGDFVDSIPTRMACKAMLSADVVVEEQGDGTYLIKKNRAGALLGQVFGVVGPTDGRG